MKKFLKSFFILVLYIGIFNACSFNQDISNASSSQNITKKYTPQTKEELKALVDDLSINLGNIDTSAITDMSWLFKDTRRTDFSGISDWSVSNVKNMSAMFYNATSFNQPLGSWNVSNVENMSGMFYEATSFNQPLDNWDVSNVKDMNGMFIGATSFNQPLDSWDVSNVENMYGMFFRATSFDQNLSKWNVKGKKYERMLIYTKMEKDTKKYPICALYTPQTKEELKELVNDLSINLGDIDTRAITDMSELFKDTQRTDFSGISNWDVSSVKDMNQMFSGATSFNEPLNNWDVSSVKYMSSMFSGATSFNQPLDSWDVSNVESMFGMFSGATSFNQPLNNWNVSNVKKMNYMFIKATSFNQPLNNWNVSNVENMSMMFSGAASFNQPLNNWNVSNVKDMVGMFLYATSFNQNLNNWEVKSKEYKEMLSGSKMENDIKKYPKDLISDIFDIKQIESTCKDPSRKKICLLQVMGNIDNLNLSHFNMLKKICLSSKDDASICFITTAVASKHFRSEKELVKNTLDVLNKMCKLDNQTIYGEETHKLVCLGVAQEALKKKDKKSAIDFSKKACKVGVVDGCMLYQKLTMTKAKKAQIKNLKAKAAEFEKKANNARTSQAYYDLKKRADLYRARAFALEFGGEEGESVEAEMQAVEQFINQFGGY